MIQDFFVSFRDNIKEKSTNPFFGTLILVWVIKNWKLIFGVFNFDKEMTLKAKLNFISEYFNPKSFTENLLIVVFYAFLALIISYLLLNASRLIVNFFEKIVTPWIYKITDKSSIVLKSVYDNKMKENLKLEARVEEERTAKIRFQEERDLFEKKLIEQASAKEEEGGRSASKEAAEVNEVEIITDKIVNKGLEGEFEFLTSRIEMGNAVEISEGIGYFVNLGLLQHKGYTNDREGSFYEFTNLGEKVRKDYVIRCMN